VQILSQLGEFQYGAGTASESWLGFARDSLYGVSWMGNATPQWVALGTAILITICIVAAFWPLKLKEKTAERTFERLVALLVIAMVLFFLYNHVLTGASFPSGRKTIVVFVPMALLAWSVIRRVLNAHQWGQASMALIGVVLIVHFARSFSPEYFREWWYDANTKEMAFYVADKAKRGDTTTLGVEWIFHPSTQFYVQTQELPIRLSPYSKDISVQDSVQYYYVSPEHVPKLEAEFEKERNFGGRFLLKRK
jgi:hypothetical protein